MVSEKALIEATAVGAAIQNLQAHATFAARLAVGSGVSPEMVAEILENLAHGFREPGDVAESMTGITLDKLDVLA